MALYLLGAHKTYTRKYTKMSQMQRLLHSTRGVGALLTLAFLLLASSCGDGGVKPAKNATVQSAEVALRWNQLFLDIERHAPDYRPCPTARALAYLGLAAYEACIPGMPANNSIAERALGISMPKTDPNQEYYWPEVVNAAYGYLMSQFFIYLPAADRQKIASLEAQLEQKYFEETREDVFVRSRLHGRAVAEKVWEWAKTDPHGHNAHIDPIRSYSWIARNTKPYDWEPIGPGPNQGLFSYWGNVRVFALPKTNFLCRPPLPYSEMPSSLLYSQAVEVYAQGSPNRPQESRWISEFWSDDLLNLTFSPAARWIAIANQVIERESASLAVALETYAKVGIALNDAAVGCFHSKYHYNIERPQAYINRLIDPTWKSYLRNPLNNQQGINPPFPAYPSEHATLGAAAAETLASIFGYSYPMTDRCHEGRSEFIGTPRSFGSFYEMAAESAFSRVLLGVHFRVDGDEGLRYGTTIGRFVNQLPWKR